MTSEELVRHLKHPQSREPAYKAHELLLGIQAERERLAGEQFVVVTVHQVFDYEGLFDRVFIECSKPTQVLAQAAAEDIARTLFAKHASRPLFEAETWQVESRGTAPYLPGPATASAAKLTFSSIVKLRASPYDSRYIVVRAFGPCGPEPLDLPLIDAINMQAELKSYLVAVGEHELNPFAPRPASDDA